VTEAVPGEAAKRVAAIVPAYNEEATLAEVLAVLLRTPEVSEVLVVSDGSTDRTVEIARSLQVRTIHLRHNAGKGMAMAVGVAHTDAPLLLFVDGDIQNLTDGVLGGLVRPVLAGSCAMNVGIRHRAAILNYIQVRKGPLLSGIRCLRREIFEAVPESHLKGFAIETGLNWACRRLGLPIATTFLYNLKHLVKEKKRGLWRGALARVQMFLAVFRAFLVLRLGQPDLRVTPLRSSLQTGLEYTILG
jgi:glycosyltransferase involved in cell wall biosynthesis